MKNSLCIILILFGFSGSAQSLVTLNQGVANLDGKQWLIVTEVSKSNYEVKDLSGNVIGMFTFNDLGGKVRFKAEFVSLVRKYEVNHPAGTTIQAVLAAYHKNKVIVDGKLDAAGLQTYCDTRKIKLTRLLSVEEQKWYDDSLKNLGKRFSFGISAGLVYSFLDHSAEMRKLGFSSPWGYHHGATYQFKSSSEKGMLTSNLGLNFEFRAKKNFFVGLGLNYTKLVYQIKDSTTCYSKTWYSYTPQEYYDTLNNFKLREEYYFSSLPVCVFYRLNRGGHFYTFGGGASITVLFRSVTTLNYGMAGMSPYQYDPVVSSPILFARSGVFGNIGGGRALGLELEFKYYHSPRGSAGNMFTFGCNAVLKL